MCGLVVNSVLVLLFVVGCIRVSQNVSLDLPVGFGGLRGRYLRNHDRGAEAKVSQVLAKAPQMVNDDANDDADDDGPVYLQASGLSSESDAEWWLDSGYVDALRWKGVKWAS